MPTHADDLLGALQAALGSAYVIEHELDVADALRAGPSMGARAFVAREPTAGRRVIIRVVPDVLATQIETMVFRREVELAASLRHPQLIALLGAGTAGEFLYYVTPWVEGESLRQWLDASGGRLPIPEAVRIAADVAGALQAAHEQGIVHRDVTPDNVFLTGAHAVVTGAGVLRALCRSLRRRDAAARGRHDPARHRRHQTGECPPPNEMPGGPAAGGWLLGTPAYMSPEQATGVTNLDGRSDIYSLGCVLYEMLTGTRPFAGVRDDPLCVSVAALPEPPRRRRSEVSRSLDDVVTKALAPLPDGRYATAAKFRQALLDCTSESPHAVAPFWHAVSRRLGFRAWRRL